MVQVRTNKAEPRMQLKPHQIETVQFYHAAQGRVLNTSEPGTGKTATIATYAKDIKVPILVVCPASVKGSWADELKMWGGIKAEILQGKSAEIPYDAQALVVNYDVSKALLPKLVHYPYGLVVFDECHFLSNRTSGRTKAALALARRTTRVIGMSGTPISNRPSDFWPILNIIQPKMFPSFSQYAWNYCDPVRKPWGWDYTGSSNLPQLHQSIKSFRIGYKLEEVVPLPKRTITVVPLDIEDEAQYREAEEDFLGWLEKNKRGSVQKAKNAEAVVKTSYILMLAARLKAKAAVRWIRGHMSDGRKVIVFCTHKDMLDVMVRRVAPGQSVYIDGSVPSSKRHAIVQTFQTDPDVKVFVGNVQSSGAGITLTAAKSTIMAELPWTPSAVRQSSNRSYRLGQKDETDLIFLVAKGTIEEKIARILQRKAEVASAILDGTGTADLPIMDMLKEL